LLNYLKEINKLAFRRERDYELILQETRHFHRSNDDRFARNRRVEDSHRSIVYDRLSGMKCAVFEISDRVSHAYAPVRVVLHRRADQCQRVDF
jgi:hypothetical protein